MPLLVSAVRATISRDYTLDERLDSCRPQVQGAHVLAHETIDFVKPVAGDRAQRFRKFGNFWIGEPVVDEETLFSAFNQSDIAKRLQMLRGVCA